MNLKSKKIIPFVIALVVIVIGFVLLFFNSKPYYELGNIPEGSEVTYINVVYTNGGFNPDNLIINTNEIVFRNLAEYSIIITSDFGDFIEGVRLNEGESYYLELEGIAEYYFQEQKSGFELVVNVKSLNNE
jgi:hypothetical protein